MEAEEAGQLPQPFPASEWLHCRWFKWILATPGTLLQVAPRAQAACLNPEHRQGRLQADQGARLTPKRRLGSLGACSSLTSSTPAAFAPRFIARHIFACGMHERLAGGVEMDGCTRQRPAAWESAASTRHSAWRSACISCHALRRFDEMSNTWANLRVLLATNFEDLNCEDVAAGLSVKQRALLKARTVHCATGLGAMATATSAHVEAEGSKPASEALVDVETEDRLDVLVEKLRPQSSNERAVVFTAAASFVGEGRELHGYAELSMPIEFAASKHATIPLSAAIDKLFISVSQALELKFVGSDSFDDFYALQDELKNGKKRKMTAGGLLLKQKILREATVLDLDILKVSSFLNHMVDVELMEACGDELAERLEGTHPTKILTVEATGLLPALFVGKALGVPLIFARKSRQMGISDSYQASYRSLTKGTTQDLYVSTEYLVPGDRVLLVDDFLAGGTTADAMVRLCRMANAKVVGGGFLIEKLNDAGRAFMSGYQVAISHRYPFSSLITLGLPFFIPRPPTTRSRWKRWRRSRSRMATSSSRRTRRRSPWVGRSMQRSRRWGSPPPCRGARGPWRRRWGWTRRRWRRPRRGRLLRRSALWRRRRASSKRCLGRSNCPTRAQTPRRAELSRSNTLSVIYDMHDPGVEIVESSSQRQAQGRESPAAHGGPRYLSIYYSSIKSEKRSTAHSITAVRGRYGNASRLLRLRRIPTRLPMKTFLALVRLSSGMILRLHHRPLHPSLLQLPPFAPAALG